MTAAKSAEGVQGWSLSELAQAHNIPGEIKSLIIHFVQRSWREKILEYYSL